MRGGVSLHDHDVRAEFRAVVDAEVGLGADAVSKKGAGLDAD